MANLKQMWDDLEPGCVRYSPALQAGQGLRPCSVQSRARHQRGPGPSDGRLRGSEPGGASKGRGHITGGGHSQAGRFHSLPMRSSPCWHRRRDEISPFWDEFGPTLLRLEIWDPGGNETTVAHREEARAVMARALGRPTGTVGNFCRDRGG